MSHIKNIETGDLIEVTDFPVWRGGVWECGSQRFTDESKTLFEPVPDPEPVPNSVTRFQAMAALELAGHLTDVETIMADAGTPIMAKLAWKNALEFFRDSPTVSEISSALSMTSDEIDQLFVTASGISA